MANFNTHLNVSLSVTGIGAAVLLSANHIEMNTALWLWFLGTLGGLLPDVDSDNSTSLDCVFNLLTLSLMLMVVRLVTGDEYGEVSLLVLLFYPAVVYLTMSKGVRPVFEKLTIHRGVCHSFPFILFFSLVAVFLTYQAVEERGDEPELIAWLSGIFVLLGGLIHLVLDEIYSVDLLNVRIKKSFGTALKLIDTNNKSLSFVLIISCITLALIVPPIDDVIDVLSDWSSFNL